MHSVAKCLDQLQNALANGLLAAFQLNASVILMENVVDVVCCEQYSK